MPTPFRRVHALAAVAGAATVALSLTTASLAQQDRRTVRDGVFAAQQVTRGERVFQRVCADCHEIEEFTGPGAFLEESEGGNVWEVFDYIWSEMPEDDPSSLEPEQYADVLSYVLSVYGLPTGAEPLPTTRAELRRIIIVRPELPGS